MHTPAHLVYALEPRWRRFVALVGLDDALLDQDHGMLAASRVAACFRVFVDGVQVAASPTLRRGTGAGASTCRSRPAPA